MITYLIQYTSHFMSNFVCLYDNIHVKIFLNCWISQKDFSKAVNRFGNSKFRIQRYWVEKYFFWKPTSKIVLRNYELSFKKHFSTQNFFQWLWETFLCVVWLRSSYLRDDCLTIVLYIGKKKSGMYDTWNRLYQQETWKSLHFYIENEAQNFVSNGSEKLYYILHAHV